MHETTLPLILITNDDGITSPGLWAAVQAVFDDFAPKAEKAVAAGEEPDYDALRKALIVVLVSAF